MPGLRQVDQTVENQQVARNSRAKDIAVYLEVGKKRTLAGALDWPGWCRGGRDEEAALQALLDYGPRYERVLRGAGHGVARGFQAPADIAAFTVVERVTGNATTDFGAPDVPPSIDAEPLDDGELRRLQELLKACWAALDAAAGAAKGKELRKGPRGGGRDPGHIVGHVLDAESSYLSKLGGKLPASSREDVKEEDDPSRILKHQEMNDRREAILETLAASAHGEIPPQGPRGGARWTARYFVRRAAWHILDHVWEIEDRII
jgi:hypothetical protein